MTSVPENSFILGTMEGQAIPLSAARAKYSKQVTITNGSTVDIDMPEELNLVTFFGSADFEIVYLDSTLPTVAGWDKETFRGVKGVFYDLITPARIRVVGRGSGAVTMNCLVRWSAISNEGKYLSS